MVGYIRNAEILIPLSVWAETPKSSDLLLTNSRNTWKSQRGAHQKYATITYGRVYKECRNPNTTVSLSWDSKEFRPYSWLTVEIPESLREVHTVEIATITYGRIYKECRNPNTTVSLSWDSKEFRPYSWLTVEIPESLRQSAHQK